MPFPGSASLAAFSKNLCDLLHLTRFRCKAPRSPPLLRVLRASVASLLPGVRPGLEHRGGRGFAVLRLPAGS